VGPFKWGHRQIDVGGIIGRHLAIGGAKIAIDILGSILAGAELVKCFSHMRRIWGEAQRSSAPPKAWRSKYRFDGLTSIPFLITAARPSGTEDVYKIYAESFRSEEHLSLIQQEAQIAIDCLFKDLKQT